MTTNFGAAAEDYARFRAGFPDSLFDRLAALGIGDPGETIVDVGTGTGTLARGFALRGCKVIGIDPDGRLLDQARRLDDAASTKVEYKIGSAEAIPLPDGIADVVRDTPSGIYNCCGARRRWLSAPLRRCSTIGDTNPWS